MRQIQHNPLEANFQVIRDRVHQACQHANRSVESLRWIAVSKYHSLDKIQFAADLGITDFGENYLQELEEKSMSKPDLHWVFTGQLQSNKIKKIMQHACEIQTVTSLKHGKKISEFAGLFGYHDFPIFIQVNAGNEPSKAGVAWDEASALSRQLESLPHIRLQGVMAIPPKEWQDVSMYRDIKNQALDIGQGLLSIGMSGDLELAIEGGSDCLRLGTCLFGPRSQ